jgi:hypothetical protein
MGRRGAGRRGAELGCDLSYTASAGSCGCTLPRHPAGIPGHIQGQPAQPAGVGLARPHPEHLRAPLRRNAVRAVHSPGQAARDSGGRVGVAARRGAQLHRVLVGIRVGHSAQCVLERTHCRAVRVEPGRAVAQGLADLRGPELAAVGRDEVQPGRGLSRLAEPQPEPSASAHAWPSRTPAIRSSLRSWAAPRWRSYRPSSDQRQPHRLAHAHSRAFPAVTMPVMLPVSRDNRLCSAQSFDLR